MRENLFKISMSVVVTALLAVSQASAICGDAIVDVGEDCDDGSSQNGGANSCCTTGCKFSGESPDVIVGDVTGTTNYGTVGAITAFAVGTTSCNLGSCWLNWIQNTPEHPVIGQNMFRLEDGRFEQVGQAWLKHGYTALAQSLCATCITPPSGAHLGVNCSDPYSSSLNGTQTRLGPKDDVNPNTGVFPFPDSRESTTGDAIFKRLQVHNTDLNPTLNVGALYFVEGQYVTHDDASAKNQANNSSYRPATVAVNGSSYNLSLSGSTVRQKAGIQAWKAADPSVTETLLAAPEGQFIVSAKATSLGGGVYHYEYAVQNLYNQRAGQSFSVPIPVGTIVTNVGFHDVDYHSGTPYVGTDWTPTVGATSVSWACETYDVNQNANALRWGTLYNFRFDANVAPGTSSATLGLFRPGAPASVTVTTVTPGPCGGAPNGTGCSDNNACTLSDSCQSGVCTGTSPVICTASDACHDAGTCAPATGACSNPAKPDGTGCADGNACTLADACQSGVCTGSPVVCAPSDTCHLVGTCAPATGACSNPAAPDGTACADGDGCTQTDACESGVCIGTNPAVCAPIDACHDAGTCVPATGACTTPAKPNGFGCDDGNACTSSDACDNGVCTGVGGPLPGIVDDGVSLAQNAGVTTITWTPAADSTASSILRGLVSGLPVGPGGGDEVCLADGVLGGVAIDSEDPPVDAAFWYLVQGTNTCGGGPYGFETQNQVETTPRVSATCP